MMAFVRGDDALVLDDGCCDVPQVRPKRVREAHARRQRAFERTLDLGPIEGAIKIRVVAVGDEHQRIVDDHNARPCLRGDVLDRGRPGRIRLRGKDGCGGEGLHLELGDEGRALIVSHEQHHRHRKSDGDQCRDGRHDENEATCHDSANR